MVEWLGAVVLVSAMATTIVTLGFGLILGSTALAAMVAFGLGGREVAGEQLRRWARRFGQD